MKEPVIIEELGKIWGRDAIYLDKIEFDGTRSVKLTGEFNGALCEHVKNSKWITYELIFSGVLEFKVVETDFFFDSEYTSSFERVKGSEKIKDFSNRAESLKLKDSHEHFILHTYDDIIELVAGGFEIQLKSITIV